LEDLNVDGRKWDLKEEGIQAPQVDTSDGPLWTRWWTVEIDTYRGFSRVATQLPAFKEKPLLHFVSWTVI